MAKKVKDWYDQDLLVLLSDRIDEHTDALDREGWISTVVPQLDALAFSDRLLVMTEGLYAHLALDYPEALDVFTQILGPELPTTMETFNKGYWLWPISKYVELYGLEHAELSLAFSKELTKRFTAEYCVRPFLEADPIGVLDRLIAWSVDPNARVRRAASECARPHLPWAKKSRAALTDVDRYRTILTNLKDDPDKAIQKSVGNNLNDLYKEDEALFTTIITDWSKHSPSPTCQWIITHGSRTKTKQAKARTQAQ